MSGMNRVALIDPATGAETTYGALKAQIDAFAGALAEPVLLVPYLRHLIRVRNRFLLRSLLAG